MSAEINETQGDKIVALARKWLGTPYVHQASSMGHGADCLGLVSGVLQQAGVRFDEAIPDYSPDWGQANGSETMLEAAHRHFDAITFDAARPGDLLVFRWKHGLVAKHAGILSGEGRFIHAYENAGVVESTLNTHWRKKIAGIFRLAARPEHTKQNPFAGKE